MSVLIIDLNDGEQEKFKDANVQTSKRRLISCLAVCIYFIGRSWSCFGLWGDW